MNMFIIERSNLAHIQALLIHYFGSSISYTKSCTTKKKLCRLGSTVWSGRDPDGIFSIKKVECLEV